MQTLLLLVLSCSLVAVGSSTSSSGDKTEELRARTSQRKKRHFWSPESNDESYEQGQVFHQEFRDQRIVGPSAFKTVHAATGKFYEPPPPQNGIGQLQSSGRSEHSPEFSHHSGTTPMFVHHDEHWEGESFLQPWASASTNGRSESYDVLDESQRQKLDLDDVTPNYESNVWYSSNQRLMAVPQSNIKQNFPNEFAKAATHDNTVQYSSTSIRDDQRRQRNESPSSHRNVHLSAAYELTFERQPMTVYSEEHFLPEDNDIYVPLCNRHDKGWPGSCINNTELGKDSAKQGNRFLDIGSKRASDAIKTAAKVIGYHLAFQQYSGYFHGSSFEIRPVLSKTISTSFLSQRKGEGTEYNVKYRKTS
ncbi:unnamed protein product [Soboliphyme baturini]|uniref:Pep_M12B_propep domain-containing protein n=1 Tax=Soboliphyme baturini TaxID=241478 RepID=A0A183ICB9_9BILA|nr:unnamed protein product [Soboliphyme baturini]